MKANLIYKCKICGEERILASFEKGKWTPQASYADMRYDHCHNDYYRAKFANEREDNWGEYDEERWWDYKESPLIRFILSDTGEVLDEKDPRIMEDGPCMKTTLSKGDPYVCEPNKNPNSYLEKLLNP